MGKKISDVTLEHHSATIQKPNNKEVRMRYARGAGPLHRESVVPSPFEFLNLAIPRDNFANWRLSFSLVQGDCLFSGRAAVVTEGSPAGAVESFA